MKRDGNWVGFQCIAVDAPAYSPATLARRCISIRASEGWLRLGGAIARAIQAVDGRVTAAGDGVCRVRRQVAHRRCVEKEAGLHKAIAALTRIEDAERQLRAARAARRAKAKEKAADSLCATRS